MVTHATFRKAARELLLAWMPSWTPTNVPENASVKRTDSLSSDGPGCWVTVRIWVPDSRAKFSEIGYYTRSHNDPA